MLGLEVSEAEDVKKENGQEEDTVINVLEVVS